MDARDLMFAGIARQAELVSEGEASARELVEASLSRIDELNPRLNAFRVVFAERALTEADQADARAKGGDERPLLGVPIAIKDDTDVAGEVTTHGTSAYGPPPTADAEVVKRLRSAGAIVVGKTNVPELEQWPFTETMTFGVTRNPWDPDRTPGGSSGGSAAAVAAGMVGLAQGSDGAGSIRIPAACCGLFGIKPARGRISNAPKPEGWHGMAVYGPLAWSVRDAALFLDVVSGGAPGDAVVAPAPERPFAESAATRPERLRIAVSRNVPPGVFARLDRELAGALDETVELLRSLGHDFSELELDYGLAYGNHVTARYLRGIRDDARALAHPRRLERRTRGMVRLGGLISDSALARVRAGEAALAERLGRVFSDHDVLLTPALARPAEEIGHWEGRSALPTLIGVTGFTPWTPAWNATGQPAASIPAGLSRGGLPLAVQVVGRPNDEATLLSLAAQVEAERPWDQQRPPIS